MIDYSRYPRQESIAFFEKAMNQHDKVAYIRKISEYYYEVIRENMPSVNVLVTNFYTVGLANVQEILSDYNDIDCIVTISNWNGYTQEAQDWGTSHHVGVFKMDEFMGALNVSEPYRYLRPKDRENNSEHPWWSAR